MAVREIVKIDEEKCTGCGDCIVDCAEGALAIVDGKARLIGEMLCDGAGFCLGKECYHHRKNEDNQFYRLDLAASYLGFAGRDEVGLSGLEFAFDGALRGAPSTVPALRDVRGRKLAVRSRGSEPGSRPPRQSRTPLPGLLWSRTVRAG